MEDVFDGLEIEYNDYDKVVEDINEIRILVWTQHRDSFEVRNDDVSYIW